MRVFVQCTPVQLEILRRYGAMPISSRRCGMITRREAERLVTSFLEQHSPPKLPDAFAFDVAHLCGWGCRGSFMPARYNSSRAKCIRYAYPPDRTHYPALGGGQIPITTSPWLASWRSG